MKFLRVGRKLVRVNPRQRIDRFGTNYVKDSVEGGDDVFAVLVHDTGKRSSIEGVFSDRRDAKNWIKYVGKGQGYEVVPGRTFEILDISLDHWYD